VVVTDRPQLDDQTGEIRCVVGAATDTGGRDSNEDAVYVTERPSGGMASIAGERANTFVLAVADGMGGHASGEIASQIAVETLASVFADNADGEPALLLKQAFRRANEAIYDKGENDDPNQAMGTTLVAAVLTGKYATIASIGDSRAYLVRANQLTQITKDHSLVAEQVSQGVMTSRQARQSPQRNVLTHALGHRPKLDARLPGIFELTLLPQDRLLLCSDGFYDVVADADLIDAVVHQEPDAAARRLVALAIERGTTDNVSAVVVEAVPTRIRVLDRELTGTVSSRGPFGGSLVPVLAAVAAIIFVALVILALMVLQ